MKINDFGALASNNNTTAMVKRNTFGSNRPSAVLGFRTEQGSADYT